MQKTGFMPVLLHFEDGEKSAFALFVWDLQGAAMFR